ncbi:MAG: hypothetical protein KAS18_11420 [Calditrichia bacterium]|nr:hypothetical protein [Calditrichia bacterium]
MNLCKFIIAFKKIRLVVLAVCVVLLFYTNGSTAFEKSEIGAAQIAMGNAGVAVFYSPHIVYYNPALLFLSDNLQIVMTYQNYYGLHDLNEIDISSSFPLGDFGFSLALNRFGNEYYQEVKITAGSGFEIAKDCALGISTQCYFLRIHNYGQEMSWGINMSFFYNLLPGLSVGALATNINQPEIAEINENLPLSFNLGFCYQPMDEMILVFEIYRDIRFEQEYRAGLSYRIYSPLIFRMGIEDKKDTYSFGVGIITGWIDIDYALRVHHSLGASHIISVIFDL